MNTYRVIVRTACAAHALAVPAASTAAAAEEAATRFADVPCGITVTDSEVRS